jgi:hypothetical protein
VRPRAGELTREQAVRRYRETVDGGGAVVRVLRELELPGGVVGVVAVRWTPSCCSSCGERQDGTCQCRLDR